MSGLRLLLPLTVALVATLAVTPFAACSDYETEEAAAPDGASEATSDAAGDGGDAGTSGCVLGSAERGCPCPQVGEARECALGVVGGASSCTTGTQTCGADEGGTPRWGECAGARGPSPEVCNAVDDDCDGVVDEGCPCTEDVDLCKRPDGTLREDGRYVFSIPARPKANEPYEVVVLAKEPIPPVDVVVGGACYAPTTRRECASAGRGCTGWMAARFVDQRAQASVLAYQLQLIIGSTPAPCDPPGAAWASGDVVVE